MRWSVEQRLEFIDFRLYWEGAINRSDIMEQFGVSVPQASKDLNLYENKAPGNLFYDKSAKRYLASAQFRAVFFKPDADRYLTQLRTVADHMVKPEETWLSTVPMAESMPVPHRLVNVSVLRSVLRAVRQQRALRVLYQSMNAARPEPMWRLISPHAFGNDNLRWHVRAYCHTDRRFKDFVLSRCLRADGGHEKGVPQDRDTYWNNFFDVVLVPNPLLSPDQQKVIALDYCMSEGRIRLSVRRAPALLLPKEAPS